MTLGNMRENDVRTLAIPAARCGAIMKACPMPDGGPTYVWRNLTTCVSM
jgi:hypothetical protein